MISLWKDLLFLHGHMLRKENLEWRPDVQPTQASDKHNRKTKRTAVACSATVWPRIMGPR